MRPFYLLYAENAYVYKTGYRYCNPTVLYNSFSSSAKRKGKAIPVTGRGYPEGYETSKLTHFLDNRLTDGGEVASLKRRIPRGRFLVLISVRG
jgi:hypothetical protein